jgi:hypothetical protein
MRTRISELPSVCELCCVVDDESEEIEGQEDLSVTTAQGVSPITVKNGV